MRDFDQEWIELTNNRGNSELIQISKIQSIQPDDQNGTIIHFTGDPKEHGYTDTYKHIKQKIFNAYGH